MFKLLSANVEKNYLGKKKHFLLIFMQTSTPASSFIVKSNTPDVSKPGKFQRTDVIQTGSPDSLEASDEDHKLPYRYVEHSSIWPL